MTETVNAKQRAEHLLERARALVQLGRFQLALETIGDAAEAIGSLFVNEMARQPKARA